MGESLPDVKVDELLRQGSESLAGRIAYHELGGLSLEEVGAGSVQALWLRGGFPLSFLAPSEPQSDRWRRQFIRAYLERDLSDLGIQLAPATMRRFWAMLAHSGNRGPLSPATGPGQGRVFPSAGKYLPRPGKSLPEHREVSSLTREEPSHCSATRPALSHGAMGTCAILSEPILPPAPPAREGRARRSGPAVDGPGGILAFRQASSRRLHRHVMDFDRLEDEELIARARQAAPDAAEAYLSALYRRYQPKVAAWCLRICNDRDEAADVAQEVFLRVHERLGSFRGDSRFSTWLYTVTRSVAINRGVAARRRQTAALDDAGVAEPVEPSPGAERELERREVLAAFREAMARDLEPLEAKVLYLHFVHGMRLAAITDLLALDNKSGAKAYVVSGGRKLKRRFGKWLARQSAGGRLS